jgi:trans-aconitate methyltransferase
MDRKHHWEDVYTNRDPLDVSWYQREPELSLALIEATGIGPSEGVIDVGGGASTLVDHLLARGFTDLSVLDVSGRALAAAEERLGGRGSNVEWIEADITAFRPSRYYALWHDRAVFHVLTEADDRARYRAAAAAGLASGSHFIVATFAPDGPEKCSGLPVMRYDDAAIAAEFDDGFDFVESRREVHTTPGGAEQRFAFFRFRRR